MYLTICRELEGKVVEKTWQFSIFEVGVHLNISIGFLEFKESVGGGMV